MDNTISQTDMTAEEFFNGLFNLDWMTEEEKQTIYQGAELFAKGKVHQASLHQCGGWVKASERLPEVNKDVCIRIDDVCKTAYWDGESAFIFEGRRYPPTLYFVEWLDESTPIPIQTPCVELEKEVERLKDGIQDTINWLQKNRPRMTGTGAPISILTTLLHK